MQYTEKSTENQLEQWHLLTLTQYTDKSTENEVEQW